MLRPRWRRRRRRRAALAAIVRAGAGGGARLGDVCHQLEAVHGLLRPCAGIRAAGERRCGDRKDRQRAGRRQRELDRAQATWRRRRAAETRAQRQRGRAFEAIQARLEATVEIRSKLVTHLVLCFGRTWPALDDNEPGPSNGNRVRSGASSVRILTAAIRSRLLTVRSETPVAAAISLFV